MIVEKNKSGLSFHMIRNVAQTEYIKWICNPRILIFMILYVFLYDYIIQEMLKAAHKMVEMLMVFEPFIAMTNSSLLIMVIPAVFIVLVSDFPKTDGNTMFYISRVGKNNWMFGQLLFGIMAAGSYLMSILVISVTLVVRHSFGKNMWSNVITSYIKAFPNETGSDCYFNHNVINAISYGYGTYVISKLFGWQKNDGNSYKLYNYRSRKCIVWTKE